MLSIRGKAVTSVATSVKKGADSRFPPEAMGWKRWRLDNWPEQKRIRAPVSERATRELECSAEWSSDNIGIARLQTK